MLSLRLQDLYIEGSLYVGAILSAVIYGIYLAIYCLSITVLLSNKNITRFHRNLYIALSSVLLLLNTPDFLSVPYVDQVMWILERSTYPGGPLAYYNLESNRTPASLLGNIAQTLAIALNNGLLTYRCYVVFGSNLHVVILPVLCSLGSLALGITSIQPTISSEWPNSDLMLQINRLTGAGIVLDTAVNVMITVMISFKILSASRMLRKSLASAPAHTRVYTNVVAILVESAAPCAILGILNCTGWFVNADTLSVFGLTTETILLTWSMSIALFPQLIIYRVARGSAWTKKTSQELTQLTHSLAFAPRAIGRISSGFESSTMAEGLRDSTMERIVTNRHTDEENFV